MSKKKQKNNAPNWVNKNISKTNTTKQENQPTTTLTTKNQINK
jgi:hypothetical protein